MDKLQWDEPFTWMSGVRDRSPQLPAGFFLGPQVTGAFCGTVAAISHLVTLEAKSTLAAIGVVLGQIRNAILVLLIALTVIGIPFAIWKYVEWQFVQQEILFKDTGMRAAFRGSTRLVRGNWWRTVRVAGLLWLISTVTGPMLG